MLAFDIAKHLQKMDGSPYHNIVRFDSRNAGALKQLPLSTLMARGSSDLAFSLVGLARIVGMNSEWDAETGANILGFAYMAIKDRASELYEPGKVLTPPKDGGTKGSATMLITLAIALAYRLAANRRTTPTNDDINALIDAAKNNLDEAVEGNFDTKKKRDLAFEFCAEYLEDLDEPYHSRLPRGLVEALSPSAFGVEALPKEQKAAAPKKGKGKGKKGEAAAEGSEVTPSVDATT
jgi:hypothetical protein